VGQFSISANTDIDIEGKKDAKKRFTEVKNVLRPMVSFLELVMRITGDDESVAAGQVLNLNQMMARISENPSLYLQLRQTTIDINTKDGSDRERLNKIVKRFQNEGYLLLINPESEIYIFTGRIEWLMEAIEYLMLHDEISEEDSEYDKRAES
jgi:hypothetical protein